MFVKLADDVGGGLVSLTEDEAAGVPMALFGAEEAMRSAFRNLVGWGGWDGWGARCDLE